VTGRLAVIGKRATVGEPRPEARVVLEGLREPVAVLDHGSHVVLYRHGIDAYVAPHRIDHVANLRALADLGCDRVLAISSVGSLHAGVGVGSFVVPDDFIALDQPAIAASDDDRQHVVPAFAPRWRESVLSAWRSEIGAPALERGVYWQANGPRFETPAEICMMAKFADVVGMTVASECVAACQVGLDYAAACIVDNLANGIADAPLTPEEYERGQAANREQLASALAALVPVLS
jgi:5'-methylthioadenosine phosphorylase